MKFKAGDKVIILSQRNMIGEVVGPSKFNKNLLSIRYKTCNGFWERNAFSPEKLRLAELSARR